MSNKSADEMFEELDFIKTIDSECFIREKHRDRKERQDNR